MGGLVLELGPILVGIFQVAGRVLIKEGAHGGAVLKVELTVDDIERSRVGRGGIALGNAIGAETAVLRSVFRRVAVEKRFVFRRVELIRGSLVSRFKRGR